ncbi:MAG: NAD(P)-dependent malic enzyme [Peptococcales bacterium]|jgi:malate dehydrogenase (oxaloacetate-decarboxylating)
MNIKEMSLRLHEEIKGKLSVEPKIFVNTLDDLSIAYTPGVGEPCKKILENKDEVYKYTGKGNFVAVVSDGSAVLGLGNIGPEAALPVMEGKAALFKALAGVDAFPVCLDTQDVEELIKTIKYLAPTFGGINLEDISAPRCFEIEERLKKELDIPIFHDDQHGTAVCVLAGLYNSLKIVKKNLNELKVVINGGGAAGIAISKILLEAGINDLYLVDKNGIICSQNPDTMLNKAHKEIAKRINPANLQGNLADALKGADVFIGVSRPGLVSKEMIQSMKNDAIIFAMANPEPEIYPEEALEGGARIIGTGRSDYPNQVNNVLAFPGIFKGALQVRAREINEAMKIAAAKAIAQCVPEDKLHEKNILPEAIAPNVAQQVALAVAQAARETKVNRI